MDNAVDRPTPPPGFSYGDDSSVGATPVSQPPANKIAAATPAFTRPKPPEGFSYEPPAPVVKNPNTDTGDFMRGLKTSAHQLPQLAGGAVAFGGDVLERGSKALGGDGAVGKAVTDYGLDIYKKHEADTQQLSKPSDSFTHVLQNPREAPAFLKYTAGYVGGQALESLAAAGAGALAGSEVPVAGNVAGAVTGLVAKDAVKRMVLKKAGELIAEKGLSREAAEAAAKTAVNKRLGAAAGGAAANFGMNETQELGSIYGDARDQAKQDGRELTGGDLARVGGASLAAAGVDTLADQLNLGAITKGVKAPVEQAGKSMLRQRLGAASKEVARDAAREAATEAAQTVIERAGAGQSLNDSAALQDIVDSAAAGAVGGAGAGGIASLHTRKNEAPIAATTEATAPVDVPNPGAAPGSLSDAANVIAAASGPLGRVAAAAQVGGLRPNDAAAAAAGAPPLPEQAPETAQPVAAAPTDAQAAPPAAVEQTPAAPLPWVNQQTGEVGKPTKGQLTQALADHIVQTFDTQGHMRINADDLAAQWGVTKKMINQVRPAAQDSANNRVRASQNPALNEPSGDSGQLPDATATEAGNPAAAEPVAAASGRQTSVDPQAMPAMTAAPREGQLPADVAAQGRDQKTPLAESATPDSTSGTAAKNTLPAQGSSAENTTNVAGQEPSSAEKPDNVPSQPAAQGNGVDSAAGRAGGESQGGAAGEAAPRVPGQAPEEEAAAARAGVPATETAQPAPAVATTKTPPTGGVSASGANPVHAALSAMAAGQHPEKALIGADDATVRAVAKAMGRTFSTKAPAAAIVERLGEQAASTWRGQAAKAVQSLAPETATHKVSAAARDAEGMRIKTDTGETNGRSHVDGLISNGFTKVDSRRAGDKLVHSLVNAAGEHAPIKARQLKYAQEASARHVETTRQQIDAAAHEAATSPTNDTPEPTQPQIEAGNYKKGHIDVQGLDISIENPRGSTRSGVGEDGKPWSHVMSDHYGYIRRTTGADGEHVDTYVGPHPDSKRVYVVDQLNQKTGAFDEHKIMLGFRTKGDAVRAYKSNFDPGWKVGKVKDMTIDQFKTWLKNGDTTKPAAAAPVVNQSLTTGPGEPNTPPAKTTKPRLAESAGGLWTAIKMLSATGVPENGTGRILYPQLRVVAGDTYIADGNGDLSILDSKTGGVGVKAATTKQADAFHHDLAADRVEVVLTSAPGFGSDYSRQHVLQVLHSPSGNDFAARPGISSVAPIKGSLTTKPATQATTEEPLSVSAKPAAKRGGIATNGAKVRVAGGKLQYVPRARETLEAYFKPGDVVPSYGGQDRVISIDFSDQGNPLIRVIAVDKDGNVKPNERERVHGTMPTERELVAKLGKPVLEEKPTKAPAVLFSRDADASSDEPFYSALTRAVDTAKGAPKTADAAAWRQWMDGAQRRGEFKQAEREWLGVDQWLAEQKGKVTREQLQQFVRDNQVQVQETELGDSPYRDFSEKMHAKYGDAWVSSMTPAEQAEKDKLFDAESGDLTKFSQYQLPGGTNYRELLLTLPPATRKTRVDVVAGNGAILRKADSREAAEAWLESNRGMPAARRASIVERAAGQPTEPEYRSSHFEQPNILAHVRFNERTDADGKKVLFLEEVQSDWHQAGRKQGYASERGAVSAEQSSALRTLWAAKHESMPRVFGRAYPGDEAAVLAIGSVEVDEAMQQAGLPVVDRQQIAQVGGVPDAPFKKEWPMLAMKRMVRYAAENGFDRIGWTTGAQQAARYDLSKQVDSVFAKRVGDDQYVMTVDGKHGNTIFDSGGETMSASKLADHVGKELADKIVGESDGNPEGKTYSGLDLKVGGEGMQAFYDRMLPNEVNKWAKPFGAKAGETQVSVGEPDSKPWKARDATDSGEGAIEAEFKTKAEADAYGEEEGGVTIVHEPGGTTGVHSLDITPAMRTAALGGLPLFRQTNDTTSTTEPVTAAQEVHTAKIKQIATAAMVKWKGDDVPNLRVVATPEQLPATAKVAANGLASNAYKTAAGMYDGRTIWIVASAHKTDQAGMRRILTTMAHEGVGHYGVERIVERELGAGAWTKIESATERLRNNPELASPAIRTVLDDVGKRYRGADAPTFAREFLAVSAERGVKNGLLDRAITAIRQWLRRVMPDLRLSEHELRQLLVQSDQYLRVGESQQQRVQSRAAMAFSMEDDSTRRAAAIAIAREEGVNDPERLVDLAMRTSRNEKDGSEIAIDPVTGKSMDAFELMDQLESEGKDRMGDEFSRRRGYTADQRKEFQNYLDAVYSAERSGVPMDSLQYISGVADGQLDIPSEYGGTRFSRGVDAMLDTPAFARWFGQSKVADSAGNPLPVFHGTADDFSAFDPNRSGSATAHMTATLGSFFAEDRAKAQHYAQNASQGVPAEERVIDAYLSIQKPYEMGLKEFQALDSQEESTTLREKLKAQGYDGIHLKDVGQWVAFTPTQIKSASENRGTFDSGNSNIYFSRDEADPDNPKPKRNFTDAAASIEAIEETLPNLDRSAFQQVKDWISGKARDLEPLALGGLQLRHVLELASEDPTLKKPAQEYANIYQRMDGDRNNLTIDGAAKVDALVKWARKPGLAGWLGKVQPEAKKLFDFMNAVTQLAVDPTNQYERLLMRDAGNEYKPWTKELIKKRIEVLRETVKTRSGDDKTRIYDEIKDLQKLPQREKVREQKYPELVRQWEALTPEAKEQFQVMRDHYRVQSEALEEATLAHIASLDIPEANRRTAAALVNRNFAEARVDGVYFPLSRFGDYWISATTKDGEYVFAKYESANAMQQAEKRFLASGATIEARGRQDNNYKAKDAPSGTFIGDLMGILKNAPDTVKDEIYQMYLKALPNLSLRKHGIHRKNIAGFTDDVPRAFASSVFHGAHQLSKARYGWQLTNTLEQMRERMEARRTVVSGTEAAHADALIGEINRRHDWILNPTNNALSNKATGIAFTYFLGASPASAIVNLIQVPQIVLPVLGAQHGWGRATAVLSRAMKQAIGTGGHIDKALTGEELDAYRALEKQGTFQRSATHALAGISEGDNLRSSPGYTKVMNAVSWMFHTSEVINREATGLAAYRLAREKGQTFEEALKYADQITNGTHGDYSNANRARYMQGNVQKVVLQFKNYSLAMSWLWGRNFYKAFKGEDAATRTLARRTLTGMLGMTGLFAGVIGMPIFNLLRYGAQAVHAAAGDDDEPWDFVTEFRSWLAEHLGQTAADVIADGAVSQLGANVASRVSMSDLWFRDADRQLEGEDAYNNMLQSIAGPLGGMIKNMYVGSQQFSDGHTWRGIETMLPTFAKNAMKATRFASQGVNTLRGDPIVPDVSAPQALIQAMGFQPTKIADQQRVNNALFNYQQFVQDRRQQLMNAFAMAQQAGDDDGRAATLTKIQAFNQKYPEIAIRMSNLHASLRQRARFSAEADNGIRLNKKLANRVRSEVGAMAQSGE